MVRRSNWSAAAGWATRNRHRSSAVKTRHSTGSRATSEAARLDELGIDRLPLAQQVARTEDGENDFSAVGRVEGDLDPTLEDDADSVVARTL